MGATTLVLPDVEELIQVRRGLLARREYTPLGQLTQLFFEPSTPARPVPKERRWELEPVKLEWYGKTGALLVVGSNSNGNPEIIVSGQLVKPPPIPDPKWQPSGRVVEGNWKADPGQKAPLVEQKLRERASAVLETATGNWLVFQPVQQIMFKPLDRAAWGLVQCSAGADGRHTAFLYHVERQEGHFLFGKRDVLIY